VLRDSGWKHQLCPDEPAERANRTLIASRLPLKPDRLALPDFDGQFPSNVVAAQLTGLRVLGVRVPWYKSHERDLLLKAREWLESAAAQLRHEPAVILGDLNVRAGARRGRGEYFQRILNNGWQRAAPAEGSSYPGRISKGSQIDHVLVTSQCRVRSAEYVVSVDRFTLAGPPPPMALSDHAALVVEVDIDVGER
jgi:endonuclease/exonuclease/phosphatase family metal-dependent hydrolase